MVTRGSDNPRLTSDCQATDRYSYLCMRRERGHLFYGRSCALNPGIILVCDPRPEQAKQAVTRMLDAWGVKEDAPLSAACGEGWAAVAVPPPGSEITCGAEVYTDGRDILIWAGEVFPPDPILTDCPIGMNRRGTGEWLLNALNRRGIDALADLNGAFCGAWYDHQRRHWTVFNDRMGLLPVFYHAEGDRLVVAPKAWLTWLGGGEPLAISEAGVTDLLRTQNMTEENTLIRNVHWMKGAHALLWNGRHLRKTNYWDYSFPATRITNEREQLERYYDLLEMSLRRQTTANAPLRLGISGGMDSRTYLALCRTMGRLPACFTAGWSFGEDVRFGRKLAEVAQAAYEWVSLDPHLLPENLMPTILDTDGLHNVGHMPPGAAVRAYLRDHHGCVLLEGYFHGVLGGAYVPDSADAALAVPHESSWARARLHSGGAIDSINDLLHPDLAKESCRRWGAYVDDKYRSAPADDPRKRAEYTILSGRSGRIDVLGTAFLREHAVVRTPACDHWMLDWYTTTDPNIWHGKKQFLKLFRQRFPDLARIQRTGSSCLPISENRLLREYYWQTEKIRRWWLGQRYPWTRQWGIGGAAIRACVFDLWRRCGTLDILAEPDARIYNWVQRQSFQAFWDRATADPLQATPLLGLATIEIMTRWLEDLSRRTTDEFGTSIAFINVTLPTTITADKNIVLKA